MAESISSLHLQWNSSIETRIQTRSKFPTNFHSCLVISPKPIPADGQSTVPLLIKIRFRVRLLSDCLAGWNEKRLLHDLLDTYNTLERPVVNESDPLQLSFGLTLMQIIDVDEKNQMLVTNIWLKLVSLANTLFELSVNNLQCEITWAKIFQGMERHEFTMEHLGIWWC